MKRLTTIPALVFALTFTITGCDLIFGDSDPPPDDDHSNVVEVTATHDHEANEHRFDLAADEIPSGWTTFQFNNQTHADHFVLVSKVPEGIGLQEYRDELAQVAQNFLDITNGADPAAFPEGFTYPEAGLELPAWYADTQVMGGPGITAPERTSDMTANLTPGTYILECYVKTPDGQFYHHVLGMLAELTVTEASSDTRAPRSTLEMALRNPENGGIEVAEDVEPGEHTVAVHFAEQQQYATLTQNDVHLVQLEDSTDLEALAAWMDVANQSGFTSPPAPAVFLGGVQEMALGATGYFTMDLEPGQRYAWIAEVPDPAGKGMLETFTVE